MQLNISNVRKIEKTSIDIDGITVIAGVNNTGKSTVGKLLFSIFNSMNNMDKKIEQERRINIHRIITALLQSRYLSNYGENRSKYVIFAKKLTDKIIEKFSVGAIEDIEEFLKSQINGSTFFENEEDIEEFAQECAGRIQPILIVSDKKVMTEVINRWFNNVFENQISPLGEEGIEPNVELVVKGKRISYIFKDNICTSWDTELNLLHEAFYIDNPFIIDKMSEVFNEQRITDEHLLSFLCKENESIYDGIFDAVMAKDKLEEIYAILGEVIQGDIEENQDGEYYFKSSMFAKALKIKNLSTGLKSFALIKMLLENGSIKEKDVLILDEPEIHVHPQWQLLYAKLIILLQKKFSLSLVITTHSPYFLDAIDVYSRKNNIAHKVHFYLAEDEGESASFQDVTGNIDAIYKKLSEPMQMLENLRYGVE